MAKWSIDLKKWAKKTQVDIEDVLKESSIFIFSRVILMSPVDTGRFRANWISSVGQPMSGVISDATDKSGSITISTMTGVVEKFQISDKSLHLVNSLPYAVRLEYGWSKQAPAGMVRLVARDFKNTVERAIRKRRK